MRSAIYYLPLLALGATTLNARNVLSLSDHRRIVQELNSPPTNLQPRIQEPLMAPKDVGPVVPDTPKGPSEKDRDSTGGGGGGGGGGDDSQLTISDILPSARAINIFASLTRDIESLTTRLEQSLPSGNTTLLAPLNSAMKALPRKPWEDRPDDHSGVSAASNEDKAAQNLRRFVLEHAVPLSPWNEGQENAVQTLWSQEQGVGPKIWWERRKGGDDGQTDRRVIMPGEVVVDAVLGRVGNGEVWSLREVLNYE